VAVLVIPTAGCRNQGETDKDVKVDLKTEPSPPREGPAKLTLLVSDADDRPVEGATLKLEANMAHAGMTPVFADATEETAGRYRADVEFTMAGDWFILVDGKLADGRPFKKKIDVKGVKAK
jgi:hypothetical protein